MGLMLRECKDEIVREVALVARESAVEKSTAPVAAEVSPGLSTLNLQMEDIRCLLINVSRDMSRLQERQGQLEKRLERGLAEGITREVCVRQTHFEGTTLEEAPRERITRSKSRVVKPTRSAISRTQQRTIIAWEELQEPPEDESTFPSEL